MIYPFFWFIHSLLAVSSLCAVNMLIELRSIRININNLNDGDLYHNALQLSSITLYDNIFVCNQRISVHVMHILRQLHMNHRELKLILSYDCLSDAQIIEKHPSNIN